MFDRQGMRSPASTEARGGDRNPDGELDESPSDAQRSFAPLCWLGFAIILLHNLEEALTAPAWVAEHAPELQARFGLERIPAGNRPALYTNLLVLTLIILVWIAVAS